MQLATGHFGLHRLLEFATNNDTMEKGYSPVQEAYLDLLKGLVANVPEWPGWYLWGRCDEMGQWETVYAGMTRRGKTSSLRARLREELRDEKVAIWSAIYGSEFALRQVHELYNGKWDRENSRSALKSPSRIIVWAGVEEITPEEVARQEGFLINIFNPTANRQRQAKGSPDNFTREIKSALEDELSRARLTD